MSGVPFLRQDSEAFGVGGLSEPLIEADELVVSWAAIRPEQSSGQLQSIRGAQRMQNEGARRRIAHVMAGLDLGPVSREARHDLSRLLLVSTREDVVASPSCEGGIAFDRRRPPGDDGSVARGHLSGESTI